MQETCILDSNDLEREKGITILAKNIAINYKGVKINIIDTPGHADFSGEVERTLGMADGALLIIDAQEGPMPQTRFVLRKAIDLNLKIIVVINKIDKPFASVAEVIEKTNDLFLDLATEAHHLDFPVLFAVGRDGKAFADLPDDHSVEGDVVPLLDAIVAEIPPPGNDVSGDFKMVISSLDYNSHIGRILIGKVHRGVVSPGLKVNLTHEPLKTYTIETVFVSEGLARKGVQAAEAGDIVGLTGVDEGNIGQTVAAWATWRACQRSAYPSRRCTWTSAPTRHRSPDATASPAPAASLKRGWCASWRRTSACAWRSCRPHACVCRQRRAAPVHLARNTAARRARARGVAARGHHEGGRRCPEGAI